MVESPMAYSTQTKQALERIDEFFRSVNRPEELPVYRTMLPDPVFHKGADTPSPRDSG